MKGDDKVSYEYIIGGNEGMKMMLLLGGGD